MTLTVCTNQKPHLRKKDIIRLPDWSYIRKKYRRVVQPKSEVSKYESNPVGVATMIMLLLLLSGDVERNPGPSKLSM